MIKLAGPLAVAPMQAANYTISGVPNFPERKDHLEELGYGVLDKVGNEIITDEDIGAKAQKEKIMDMYNLMTQKDIFTYPLNKNKGGVIHANVGGYAEEQNPIVSLAGEYAETTPMPAPDYKNIEAPQTQGGGGSSTGNMAKNMAMKMGMKRAANAILPGSGMIFNRGGHVPKGPLYAEEGLTPDKIRELVDEDLRIAREGIASHGWNYPYKKHLDPDYDPSIINKPYGNKWGSVDTDMMDFPRWMSIPKEMREKKIEDLAWDYVWRRRDERMEALPKMSDLNSPYKAKLLDTFGYDPEYEEGYWDFRPPAEVEKSNLEPDEVDTWVAPPSLGGDYPYKSSLREGWGVPVADPTEEQYDAEILRKQKQIEDIYKKQIEEGEYSQHGLSYANRGGHVGPPMTKEYIRKLMS